MNLKMRLAAVPLAMVAAVLPAAPAYAETDTTTPGVYTSAGYLAGSSNIKVNWDFAQAWSFSYVRVNDARAEGQCVTPFVNVNRRYLSSTGYIYLNGTRPGAWDAHPYGTACGAGSSFVDSNGTSPYNSARPISGLTGAYGVWIRLCQTNRDGVITGNCGAPSYAANNGS